VKPSSEFPRIHLGSDYGGWTIVDEPTLQGCVIISAGLGEDASFDVEFAARYQAKVVVVDTTPRAVRHFAGLHEQTGMRSEVKYGEGGKQDPRSYDLSEIERAQLLLVERALWKESCKIKFLQQYSAYGRPPGETRHRRSGNRSARVDADRRYSSAPKYWLNSTS